MANTMRARAASVGRVLKAVFFLRASYPSSIARVRHTPRPVPILSPIGKSGMSIHKKGGE